MRPGPWLLEIGLLVGPVFLVGIVAVPLLLAAFAITIAIKSEKRAREPFVWVTAAIAAIAAVLIWPGYVQTVEDCKRLEASADFAETIPGVYETLGLDPDAPRIESLERGCKDLVIKW
jgi:hypothetical protein